MIACTSAGIGDKCTRAGRTCDAVGRSRDEQEDGADEVDDEDEAQEEPDPVQEHHGPLMRLRNLISARICVRQEKAPTNSDRTHSMLWKRSGKGPGGQLLRPLP